MSVGWSGGSPRALTSAEIPIRRKCSIVLACVALACGLNAVDGFGSTTRQPTPRRPSSLASIRPQGPAPATSTSTSMGPSDGGCASAGACVVIVDPIGVARLSEISPSQADVQREVDEHPGDDRAEHAAAPCEPGD